MTTSDTPDTPHPATTADARRDTGTLHEDTDVGELAAGWPRSPFACVDTAFTALTIGPAPLTVDGDRLDSQQGLPTGPITLPALRDWLRAHPTAWRARDAVWRDLILRARLDGPAWVVAATAFALPGLVTAAAALTGAGWAGDPDDVDAEVLTGFLTALRDGVDLSRPAPYASLCRAGWRAGLALVRQQRDFLPVDDVEHAAATSRTPKPPWGHPDLLVRRAVVLGLVDACDELPYVEVRLGRRAIEPIAARLGLTADSLRMRLSRIDTRIAWALADGLLTGTPSPQARTDLAAAAKHRARTRTARACPRAGSAAAVAA